MTHQTGEKKIMDLLNAEYLAPAFNPSYPGNIRLIPIKPWPDRVSKRLRQKKSSGPAGDHRLSEV